MLWNVLYDGLLRQPLPNGTSIVAFADDVALVVVAKTIDEVEHLGDDSIEVVAGWLSDQGLRLAAEKTEAMLISRTKKKTYATFTVGHNRIKTVDTLKYLRLTLDARLSFGKHLENAGMKASRVARALAGIMPNIGGPKEPRRLLLSSVVTSVILYGAPIWADAMNKNASYRTTCRRACRTVALRVARAYRTVSNIALSLVAGLPPVNLMAAERARRYREGRRTDADDADEERGPGRWSDRTFEKWQRRWDLAREGRWTHRVIPNVRAWTSRQWGRTTFHLTQVLTGHGCFRSYFQRVGVYDRAECPVCPGVDEDVEHVLFSCPRFADDREMFEAVWRGSMTPEGMGR